ncbi:c-type cytochrome [Phyllobacterium endophyticum]|jgi:cytochrome c|uniref:Cytochrome c family protein n=1 Tax=Phyllobacterium endophyticum TaxID=1149773 RepID=A0A2P7B0J7_9HYPH|nr:cytochrome c family protein [Phyllobacterium endophyticum]MBB3235325.1 cytochrome c [Phyllobacterium endophyticum]PSH59988.1 cytochrome c family protein [Phyllobacterium endophyticum]TXR49955.1 cytochrome c family protein [Phyllobacterium endophyticum]TYR42159.1 cytochrome c family protein [Phyllobacterium endophyticum]
MESSAFNKYAMAFLATVFVVMSAGILSDALFDTHAPEKPGFIIQAAEPEAGGAGGEAAPVAAVPIATLLASADATRGEAVFKRCQACHTGEKDGANKVGPNLWDIVDRPIATHPGFAYSGPMKDFSKGGQEKWTYDHLNHFLTSPKGYIKGTAMGFAGDKKDNERADLIAYLRTLSDNPKPLPAADAAAPAGDAAAPAGDAAKPAEGAAPAAPAGGTPAEGAAPAAPAQPAPAN